MTEKLQRHVSEGPAIQYPKGQLNCWMYRDENHASNIHWQLRAFLQNDFPLLCDLLMLCRNPLHKIAGCNVDNLHKANLTDTRGYLLPGIKDIVFACLRFDIHFPNQNRAISYPINVTEDLRGESYYPPVSLEE